MTRSRGFTLIEALVAAAVLGLGMAGVTLLAMQGYNTAAANRQQLTAMTLASNAVECWRSGPTLCPGASAWNPGDEDLRSTTASGTVYTVRSQVSATAYDSLKALQVTVRWQPSGQSNASDNPMAQGSGQLSLSTRVSSVPVFVPRTTP